MNHAIAILEEEKCRLRALIRTIERNMHEVMSAIDFSKEQDELSQVEAALQALNSHEELVAALENLFEHAAMVHKRWGEGNNQRECDTAIANARAALQKAKEEK